MNPVPQFPTGPGLGPGLGLGPGSGSGPSLATSAFPSNFSPFSAPPAGYTPSYIPSPPLMAPPGPPALPLANSGGVASFCKNNKTALCIVVLVIMVAIVGFLVWRARKKAQCSSQLEEDDTEANEWQRLLQLARQPGVKEKLKGMMNTTSTAAFPPAPGINSLPNDPNFTS